MLSGTKDTRQFAEQLSLVEAVTEALPRDVAHVDSPESGDAETPRRPAA